MAASGHPAAVSGGAAGSDFVLVDVGSVLVAVPAGDVLHGIAWPRDMGVLPRREGAACGVFDYQGQPLAMLDLGLWVDLDVVTPDGGMPGAAVRPRAYARALVVRAGGHTVAFAADAVRGLQKFGADALTRVSHDNNQDDIFHSVARCSDGVLAHVLDVPRLMALARTWSGNGAAAAETAAAAPPPCAPTLRLALLPGAGCQIGFPVDDLVAVIARPALARFQSALSEGICQWRGRHLPVTSIAKCWPALVEVADTPPPLLAVFERDGLALGVLIDQVPLIRAIDVAGAALAAETAPPGAPAVAAVEDAADADGVGALTDSDGDLVRLIDMDALYRRFPERVLSRAADSAAGAGQPPATGAVTAATTSVTSVTNNSSHILFDAGGMASTPIDGIEAVLSLPPLEPGATHMAWRGAALQLRDLRAQKTDNGDEPAATLAQAGGRAPGTVIVVQGATAPVGFIVEAVHALVQPRAGRISRLALPGQGVVDLLTTTDASGQATYSTRDLARLARMSA